MANSLQSLVARHGPLKLLFFGPPGVGKGTFASMLMKKWGLPQISTGDMIRAEIKAGSKHGKQFQEYSNSGRLVPDELVCAIAENRLAQKDTSSGYILDGFPRTTGQAERLEHFSKSSLCLNFMLPDKLLVMKLAGRRVCKKCGKNFNVADINEGVYQMPPLLPRADGSCDQCGSKEIMQREDDKEDVVAKRLTVYQQETAPLIDFYTRRGVLRTFGVKKGVYDFPAVETMIGESLEEISRNARKK